MESSTGSRAVVLCFDGTGNTFRADGSDTNILKIFRMLDRYKEDQICYYQPGIGTDITPSSLASTSFRRGKKMWTNKVLDQALGNSFDQHLIGGYRFLMRHYRSGCRIYIFGFSRGAYTARFLNEMLDHVGLLGADNEEMIPFIWEAFATWKFSNPREKTERADAYKFLQVCRETMCRPIRRVSFLGLFDTVNSVAEFQVNTDMMPAAKVIRHAVSIDERRVKFQAVLLYPKGTPTTSSHRRRPHPPAGPTNSTDSRKSGLDSIAGADDGSDDEQEPDIEEIWFLGGHTDIGGGWKLGEGEQYSLSHIPLVWMVREAQRAGLRFDAEKLRNERCDHEEYSPVPPIQLEGEKKDQSTPSSDSLSELRLSGIKGAIHDRLSFGQGLSFMSVLAWRLMEYLPLGRMHLQPHDNWKLIYWPLPRGAPRDIPMNAKIHSSVIRRMESDPNYRPRNLILGHRGRGVKKVPSAFGIGNWVAKDVDDPLAETFVRHQPGQQNQH